MKRIKRLPSSVNAPDFVPTVDEDLTMIWRELEKLKGSIGPSTSTTNVTNITQVTGGKRFVATDVTISDTQETSISHGLGTIPTTIIVVPRLTHKTVYRQDISTTGTENITVNHGLNLPIGSGSRYVNVVFNQDTPTSKSYIPMIGDAGDPNTWTFKFHRDSGVITAVIGTLLMTRIPPTWWTTRPSDSTNVYLRASESFTATVIVEE